MNPLQYFSVCYRHPVTKGTVMFPRYADSRETLLSSLPSEHPSYDGYLLYGVF